MILILGGKKMLLICRILLEESINPPKMPDKVVEYVVDISNLYQTMCIPF